MQLCLCKFQRTTSDKKGTKSWLEWNSTVPTLGCKAGYSAYEFLGGHLFPTKLHQDFLHNLKGVLQIFWIFYVESVGESEEHSNSRCYCGHLSEDLCSVNDDLMSSFPLTIAMAASFSCISCTHKKNQQMRTIRKSIS